MPKRLIAAGGIGVLATLLFACMHSGQPVERVDFGWAWLAARDLQAGRDVYAPVAGPDMVPYPLPAALVAWPLAGLPGPAALAVFVGVSAGVLAWGLTHDGEWWRLLTLVSSPFYVAFQRAQWSPLMTAVLVVPALWPLVVVKPQFALPAATAGLTRWRVAGCAGLLLGSLLVDRSWPLRWAGQVRDYEGFIPAIVFPVLLLAACRWRDPRARLFLAMACMPQHRYLYDGLPLWTLPRSRTEMLALTLAGWLAYVAGFAVLGIRAHGAAVTVAGIYVPCLALVLYRPAAAAATSRLASD